MRVELQQKWQKVLIGWQKHMVDVRLLLSKEEGELSVGVGLMDSRKGLLS